MLKPLALAVAAGLIFTIGCEKKPDGDAQGAKAPQYTIPTVAPDVAKTPGAVFEHIQYAMLRKEPKHLEIFFIEEPSYPWVGTAEWFYNHAGELGVTLTADEINEAGVQYLVEKGYISDKWTSREYKKIRNELDAGTRQSIEPGMEKIDERKLDMPYLPGTMDKKTKDALLKQRREAIESNPKASYAGGLYRLLKAIPPEGWGLIDATVSLNAGGDKKLNDILLNFGEKRIAIVSVGHNPNGTMFISYVKFDMYPSVIAKLFGHTQETAN